MKLYHVVAMARARVIGRENRLPWHFAADLKYFKQLTTGSTVVMGRRTFESIGKPLPNRENFVVSRTKTGDGEHLCFFSSIEEALRSVKTEKAFIIGGANLYAQTIDRVDGIYLTRIDADYEGDAFYPELPGNFREQSRNKLQDDPLIEVVYYEK
ncbi:MAG: dihydrofolate reductase [Candidatus Omnitrophota bacterium]|jgi:dihydrofolate reductase